MNFSFRNNIDKDFILNKLSEETIFSYYLGFLIKPGKLFCSKLRSDKNPTCSFYRNKSGILYYHDFATGDTFNCFSYVMKLYNCSYHKALQLIAEDFGLIDKTSKVSPKFYSVQKVESNKQTLIQVEIKDFSEHELKWWNSYGITKKILKKFNIYSCNTVFLNGNIIAKSSQSSPIYGYYFGKKENIEQWKIYFPKRNNFRFLNNISTKIIQGYHQLPEKGKLLVITKSMKDNMALYSYGIPAISPNSENLFIPNSMLENLKQRFEKIIVLYDQDRAGKYNLAKIRRNYPELNYFVIPKKYNAKDFSDLRKLYGENKTKELIIESLNYFNKL